MRRAKNPTYDDVHRGTSRLTRAWMRKIWPGCDGDGRHMECGRVHNYEQSFGDKWVPMMQCWRNTEQGCPNPRPERTHRLADWVSR